MILAVAFVLLFALVLTGLGWSLVAALDRDQALTTAERIAIAFATGAIALHLGVFAVGQFRLDALSMGALGLLAVAAAVPGWRRMPWRAMGSAVAMELSAARGQPFRAVLWLTVIGLAAGSLLQGMAPPSDYDSLLYHLAIPKRDIEVGRIELAWAHGGFGLFPNLMHDLYRFGLATAGQPVVQMIHGLFGVAAAAGAAAIVRRVGFGAETALLGAAMYLGVRSVIWQMATSEVDVAVGAYAVLAVLAYTVWRDDRRIGLAALFGLMVGGTISVKYHGFPIALGFAPVLAYDLLRRVRGISGPVIGAGIALAVIAPILARNLLATGNPVFPLFNTVFNPDSPELIHMLADQYGTGRGILNLLRAPWDIFIFPSHYFDGVYFGAPYLLVFAPFALLAGHRAAALVPAVSVALAYFCQWFWLLSQQTRFLLPIAPLFAVFGAVGATLLWAEMRRYAAFRAAFVVGTAILFVNQSMFAGIYALLRLPVAVGLVTPESYLVNTPTLLGAFYPGCRFISRNLRADERYLAYITPQSYFCPQTAGIGTAFDDERGLSRLGARLPEMALEEYIRRIEDAKIRYLIIQTGHENRRNPTATPVVYDLDIRKRRFGEYLAPALSRLKPLVAGRFSAVYDGPSLIAELKEISMTPSRDRVRVKQEPASVSQRGGPRR